MSHKGIGPGELDTGDSRFIAKPEWVAVQQYVISALDLPTDRESMRKGLPADPPGGMAQFDELLTAYQVLQEHCQYWQDHTLEDSVGCAADIVHYNDKVPSYYGRLIWLLPKLEQHPPDEAAVEQFKAILKNLSRQVKSYAAHAELVKKGMETFAEQSEKDHKTISSLKDTYKEKLGSEAPAIKQLSEQLESDRADLKKWQDEYHDDVVKAATTPTYVWIWPFGTIASVVVAGVYGDKATKALKRVHGYQDAIRTLSAQLQAAATLLLDLTRIHGDLADIWDKLNAALPVIEHIRGVWTGIDSDVEDILRIIDEDIGQVPALIKSLGIDEAIKAWAKVAHQADVWRHTAFITVTTEEEAKKAGLELHELLKAA